MIGMITAGIGLASSLMSSKDGGGGGTAFVQQQPDSLAKKLKDIEAAAPQGKTGPEGLISRGTEPPEVTASRERYKRLLAASLVRAKNSAGGSADDTLEDLLRQALATMPQPSESPVRIEEGRLS
jgi:hypothetical protein